MRSDPELAFLDHPGDCAALMRGKDAWALDRVGEATPAAQWPDELKVLTGLILGANEPMFIAWGPGRLMLYNDAYIPILGQRHPGAMGRPMQEVWSDAWPHLEHLVDGVFSGDSVQMDDIELMLHREGQLREAHFSFGYHPVRDGAGRVVGLFCVCRETTSRLRDDRRREEEQARRWRLFEQTPGFMAVLRGPRHHVEFVNKAFEVAFGRRDVIGRPLAEVLPEAQAQGFVHRLDAVFSSRQRYQGHHALFILDAPGQGPSPRFLDFIFEPLVDDDEGTVTGVFVQGQDVTISQLAHENAQASHQRYTTLLDAMGEGLVVLDKSFRVVQINQAALRLDGRAEAEIVGRTHWEAWPGAVGTPIEAALKEAMARREPRQLEQRYVWDRQDLWLDLRAYPVPGGLALLCRDISRYKLAEEALKQSEQRFRAAVGAVGVMWTSDAQGDMRGEQPGWAQITGQSPAEYAGLGWLRALHPDDVAGTLTAWQDAVAGKLDFVFEHRVRGQDGQWRRYAVRAVPVLGADGAVREWVGVHIDVTQARKTAEALQSADRRKDKFLAILAHELRNPLAPIRSAAHVLGRPEMTPADLASCRDIITRQVRHMARLLDDLLDVSRITSGRLELQIESRPLRDILDTAVETAQPLLAAKKHQLLLDWPEPDIRVQVDSLRLSQVLSNLLLNAAKYSDQGGRVWLAARADTRQGLVIDVRDEGIGIAAEDLARVFHMFSQLRGSTDRSLGGLGIGLALSRGLIELHGGRLVASSPGPGAGSTFTVILPAALAETHAMPTPEQDHALQDDQAGSPGLPLLIADDNADAAESLGLLLGLEGYEVHVAADGVSALSMAETLKPRVAVLDIGMPGMDGHELARQLRHQPWGAGMLILAVTGWGQPEDQRRALAAGFDRHFTKPVDPMELMACIAAWRAKQAAG